MQGLKYHTVKGEWFFVLESPPRASLEDVKVVFGTLKTTLEYSILQFLFVFSPVWKIHLEIEALIPLF